MLESARIMFAQILHIAHLESGPLRRARRLTDTRQPVIRKHIAIQKRVARPERVRRAGRDPVIEEPAARFERSISAIKVALERLHVFDRADAGDLVERTQRFGVEKIPDLDLAAFAQAERLNSLRCLLGLSRAQRQAEGPYSIMFGRVANQRAPATAHVEKPFPRLEPQFATNQIELRHLRLVDGSVRFFEIGAAVNELRIEPEPPEFHRQIVVVTDRLPRPASRMTIARQSRRVIGPPRMAKQRPRNPQLIGDRCFSSDDLIGDRKHVAQISDDIDIAIDIRLAESQ